MQILKWLLAVLVFVLPTTTCCPPVHLMSVHLCHSVGRVQNPSESLSSSVLKQPFENSVPLKKKTFNFFPYIVMKKKSLIISCNWALVWWLLNTSFGFLEGVHINAIWKKELCLTYLHSCPANCTLKRKRKGRKEKHTSVYKGTAHIGSARAIACQCPVMPGVAWIRTGGSPADQWAAPCLPFFPQSWGSHNLVHKPDWESDELLFQAQVTGEGQA